MKKTMILAGLTSLAALTVACGGDDGPSAPVTGGVTGGTTGAGTGGTTGVGTGGTTGVGTGGTTGAGTGGTTGGGTPVVSDFVTGGLGENGTYSGYLFTAASGAGDNPKMEPVSTITPSEFTGSQICASGSVAADPDYGGWALVGWNLNQPTDEMGTGLTPMTIAPEGTGVAYNIANNSPASLRIQIQVDAEGEAGQWCADVTGPTGVIPWGEFNTTCWAPTSGTYYDGTTPIMQMAVQVPGSDAAATPFDFCVVSLGPAN